MTSTGSVSLRNSVTFQSFGQNREDVVLARALEGIEGGHYLEAGAYHPSRMSVSYAFYLRRWSGVLVEPDPRYWDLFRRRRPRDRLVPLALSSESGRAAELLVAQRASRSTLDRCGRPEGQGFVGRIPTSTITLSEILEDCRWAESDFHFMSLDLEGGESDALRGMDFKRFRPWIIVLESVRAEVKNASCVAEGKNYLERFEYCPCYFDGVNLFFVAEEHPELVDRLYPACSRDVFFDDYIRSPVSVPGTNISDAEYDLTLLERVERLLSQLLSASADIESTKQVLGYILECETMPLLASNPEEACERLRLVASSAHMLASRLDESRSQG